MKKVLLFGATGNLGKAIAAEVKAKGYDLTVVVRNKNKAGEPSKITDNFIVADVTNPASLVNICRDFEIVISSLGKSVSPNDKSKPSFRDIDLTANSNILNEAVKSGVMKFVYVSAFQSEKHLHLEYFKVHHDFSQLLIQSGINYSIIKPPAIFCGFLDMITMARNGKLINIGKGDKTTNPIYEGDLAGICVGSINEVNAIIEAGGKEVYTRKQLLEIIQSTINPEKKIINVPLGLMKFALILIKLFDKNTFDKFSFFIEVIQNDTLAPRLGEMKFEDYIKKQQIKNFTTK